MFSSSLHFLQFFNVLFQVWFPTVAQLVIGRRTSVLYPCFWCLVKLAFLDASVHCPEGFVLLCILTPKTLYSSLTLSTLLPPTLISYENVLLLMPTCITEHFSN